MIGLAEGGGVGGGVGPRRNAEVAARAIASAALLIADRAHSSYHQAYLEIHPVGWFPAGSWKLDAGLDFVLDSSTSYK